MSSDFNDVLNLEAFECGRWASEQFKTEFL